MTVRRQNKGNWPLYAVWLIILVSTIAITNEMLMDMFDEQQNVVHFKIEGEKKSYVLVKSDTKGMLNL